MEGLGTALRVAVDYGLAVIESGEERAPEIPLALLAQARLAARRGVSLDIVLRRYLAGYSLLSEFVIEEAERNGLLEGPGLGSLLRGQAAVLDRLIAALSEEHARESNARADSRERRRAERVERLLAGEPIDSSELQYDFKAHHLAMIVRGPGAPQALREITASLDARLLMVRREEGAVWAWFGGRRAPEPAELQRLAASLPPQVHLAIGEPGEGLPGWRISHRQARAALPIAQRSPQRFARYANVALLASSLKDDLLVTFLREFYLRPLERAQDRGEVSKETLRAYFSAGRNVASTAAALGLSRQAVNSRLRTIEQKLGRRLQDCAVELETALRVEALATVRVSSEA